MMRLRSCCRWRSVWRNWTRFTASWAKAERSAGRAAISTDRFTTMDGMVSKFEVAAVRLNSDVIQWGAGPGGIRKDKQRTAPGEKFIGLILLFSTRNGEPLAIMPDGVIQRLRVACA